MSILQTLHYILPCNLKHYISYLCDFIFDNWNFTIQQQSLKKNSSVHSVQFSRSVVSDSATLWITARQASLSITNSRSSLRLTSIESMMPSSHLILCRPLLLLPPIPPIIRVFSNESTLCMRWPKYWSFSFSIIPSKEILGLIFRMDWLDLLAVQGTLKHIHKQRHHFANKGLSSHGHGFSCGHIWMWELDCEEGWAPKNWCFWTVVFCTLVPTVLQPIRLMS